MIDYRRQPMLWQCRQAKRKPAIIWQILIFIAVFMIPTLLTGVLLAIPTVVVVVLNPGINEQSLLEFPMITLLSLFLTGITTFAAIGYCIWIEKRSGLSMGFRKETLFVNYGKGLFIGTVLIVLCAGIAWAMGGFRIEMVSKIPVGLLLLYFLGFVIQGSSEEVLIRGYFMMSLSNRCAMAVAVGVSSVVFSLLHIFNPGFGLIPLINIALFGVFMGVYVLREGDLWGACAIHSAWNFVQGNVLGIQVSGTGSMPTVVRMIPKDGMELINGGSFGIEASLIVTLVLLIATLLTIFLPQRKPYLQ